MARIARVSASRAFGAAPLVTFEVDPRSRTMLAQMQRAVTTARARADTPDVITRGLAPIAQDWVTNFRTEGGMVGGWQPLKPRTEAVRRARGYAPSGPILRQHDELYRAVTVPFLNWPLGKTNTGGVPVPATTPSVPGVESGPSLVTGVATPRRFTATISGAKAVHQTGGDQSYLYHKARRGKYSTSPAINTFETFGEAVSYVPRRQFWFFRDGALTEAARLMSQYLVGQMLYEMPGADLTGFNITAGARTVTRRY